MVLHVSGCAKLILGPRSGSVARISTGEPEGFSLSVPGFNFDTPFLGLTHISIPEEASGA